MIIRRALLLSSAIGAACAIAGAAQAQTAAAPSGAAVAPEAPSQGADVIVTAEKRTVSVQKVPVAISAFTSKQRDLLGIQSIVDLTNFTPGLRYAASLDRLFLRGVGRQTNNLATDPGVATYVDGVYNSQTYTAAQDDLFVQRIEVLRGPQGTLYGRNGIGGAINSISATPTHDFYAEVRAGVANYGQYSIEGVVSGPISDDVRFRLGGEYTDQSQGYFKNVANGTTGGTGQGSSYYLEAQLEANIGKVDAWAKLSTYSFNGGYGNSNNVAPLYPFQTSLFSPYNPGYPNQACVYSGCASAFTQTNPALTGNPGFLNKWDYSNNSPTNIQQTGNYFLVGHLTWHADGADVKYIGGVAHYDLTILGDGDGTDITSMTIPLAPLSTCSLIPGCGPITFNPSLISHYAEHKTFYSNELDVLSTNPGPFQWVVGLYQYHEQYTQPVSSDAPFYPGITTPVFFGGPAAAANPNAALTEANQDMHADSYAGFAQIDWKITPDLKFTGGVRYTYDDKSGDEFFRDICAGCSSFGPGVTQPELGTDTPVIDATPFVVSTAPAPGVAGPVTTNAAGFAVRALSGNWSALTGTLGFEWTPQPDLLIYAKYSRGYKAGGFNSGTIAAKPEIAPEYLDDYEAGFKKTFGHTLTIDGAAFFYSYTGMQVELGTVSGAGTLIENLSNLGDVHNWGLELESIWQATDNLQFILSYAYLNTQIQSGCSVDLDRFFTPSSPSCAAIGPVGNFSVKGDQLIDSPPNKIAINANYTFHFDPGNLTLSASDIWTDYHYSSIFSTPDYYSPGYNELDLRALWTDSKNRYTVIVYGKNVLNAVEYDYKYPLPEVGGIALQAPATYGVQLQVRFR